MKKFLSTLLAVSISLTMFQTAMFAAESNSEVGETAETEKNITLGTAALSGYDSENNSYKYIYYGTYTYYSTFNESPIKWRILTMNGNGGTYKNNTGQSVDSSNAMFLLSEYGLKYMYYEEYVSDDDGDGQNSVTDWRYSDAWYWCNNATDEDSFISGSFTDYEKKHLLKTSKESDADREGTTSELKDDTFFFLSKEEAESNYIKDNLAAIMKRGNGEEMSWYLRTPHKDKGCVYDVKKDGDLGYVLVSYAVGGRPAFNLNLSSVLFTSVANGGKTVNTGSTLTAVDNNTASNEYKLTIKDDTRTFNVTESSAKGGPGETIWFNYSNAEKGDNEYISAMIVDDSDEVLYYGRLANITKESMESGKVSLSIPSNIAVGTYQLKLFNEEINGDCKTDFSSGFQSVTLTVEKAQATFTTKPSSNSLTYNGVEQELVTAGESNDGEVLYSSSENGTYTEDIPKGNEAKEYTVWYYIKGDSMHFDSAKESITVTISPKTVNNATIDEIHDQTYTGSEIKPTITVKDGDTEIPESEYEVVYSNNINAGEAIVTVTNRTGGNYIIAQATQTFNIKKAEATAPTGLTAVYGQTLANVSLPSGWTWAEPDTTNVGDVGTQTHKANYEGDKNHYAANNVDVTVTVSRSGATMTASVEKNKYTYGETVKITVNGITPTGEAAIGLFYLATPTTNQVAIWNGDTQLTEPQTVTGNTLTFDVTGLNEGTYTLTAKFTGNGNMAATSADVSVSIEQAEPTVETPKNLTATYGDTLKSIDFPDANNGTWTWVKPANRVGDVGTQKHQATFTPNDKTNYKAITVDVSVEVAKATINSVSLDVGAPIVFEATPTTFPTWNTGYTATVAWDPTDATFRFNTAYTATVTLTADSNHKFADGISVADWSESGNNDVLTFVRTFEKTRKEYLNFLVIYPADHTLDEYCEDVSAVIEKLSSNVTYQTETGDLVKADIDWFCENFDSTVNAQNTFTWSVKNGELSNYNNAVPLATTGSITVTNASAVTVTHSKEDRKIPYTGTTYDVSKMFTMGTTTGAVSYEIVSGGTGAGTLNGEMLTITKAGTIIIKMSTAADKQYAASDITATLTVEKAKGTGTVSMTGWTYGETANDPSVSDNKGEATYQYKVKGSDDSTYSGKKPSDAGKYTVKATFAETDLYNEASATADFTIDRRELKPSISGTVSKVYDGTSDVPSVHSLTINLIGIVNDDDVSATASFAYGGADVGTTEIKATNITLTGEKSVNYRLSTTEATANAGTITKADSSVTAPTANTLTYNGTAQELVTSGAANGGTLKYSLNNVDWTETIPTGTDATSYEVWYKVFGDNNHNDTTADKIDVTIAKKSIADATVAPDGELTYNGQKQTQKATVTLDGFTNVTFDISDNEQTDVKTEGDYTLTVTGSGNFEGTRTLDWNIKPYTPTENSDMQTTARVKKGKTLAEATVTNGEMLGVDGVTALVGTFAWADDTTESVRQNCTKKMTFTPNDTNYASVTFEVAVNTYSSSKGNGSSTATATYTVTFEPNGGSKIGSIEVEENNTAEEPKEPTKDGFEFDGWYTDKKLTIEYDFDTKVTKPITLYAAWTEKKADDNKDDNNNPTPNEWKNPFTDVAEKNWFFDDVYYANQSGLMNGITDTTFAPNENLTRGMLVTVLYRAEGEPTVNESVPFSDVNASQYYANAVIWAEQNGIVKGVSERSFAPDENITREQIAAMMFRYAEYKGIAPTGAWAIRLNYADVADISDYAVDGVMYCTMKNIMQGKNNNMFAPKENATRAEIAAILNRFIESNK